MSERRWICTNCDTVFIAFGNHAEHCGPLEEFDPVAHAGRLVGLSNSWISVWNRWKGHPLLEEAAQEVYETGNYGASMILNAFIENLLRHIELEEEAP